MTSITLQQTSSRLAQFLALTKPRVVSLIVFCAVIGMFLATPGAVPLRVQACGVVGTATVSGLPSHQDHRHTAANRDGRSVTRPSR